jgi:hypothetical protein
VLGYLPDMPHALFSVALAADFQPIADGIELATDAGLTIVRIDPARASFSTAVGSWTDPAYFLSGGLDTVLTNVGMFEPDGRSTYLLRDGDESSGVRSASAGAFFVADPIRPELPAARLLDASCEDVDLYLPQYRVVIQGQRVRTCGGEVPWRADGPAVTQAVLGTDRRGNILLIHADVAVSTGALAARLEALPLELDRLMYLQGGGPDRFGVVLPDGEVETWGSNAHDAPAAMNRLTVAAAPLFVAEHLVDPTRPEPRIGSDGMVADGVRAVVLEDGGTWLVLRGADGSWAMLREPSPVGGNRENATQQVRPLPGAPGFYLIETTKAFANSAASFSSARLRVVRAADGAVVTLLDEDGWRHSADGGPEEAPNEVSGGLVPVLGERSLTLELYGCRNDVATRPEAPPAAGTWVVAGDHLRKTEAPVVQRGCAPRPR